MIGREDCIKVGDVSKTHNLQGSVVIVTGGNPLEKYVDKPVFLLLDGAPVPFFIAEGGLIQRNRNSYIVKFDYVDTIMQAEALLGCEVLVEKELPGTGEDGGLGICDISSLVGFDATDENTGVHGKVIDAADYSGNSVLTILSGGKEILLPFSEAYIKSVDFEISRIVVAIPDELAELNFRG